MPIGFIIEMPGATQDQYDRAMVELNVEQHPPDGLISHTAGPMEGGWRVIDVWQSEAQFQAFVATRLGPATAAVGITNPQITPFPVHRALVNV